MLTRRREWLVRLAPTAIAVENPNLQVNYRQGFTIQGVYTQEELEATVRAWP